LAKVTPTTPDAFRLGWYFDERSSDPRHAINAAAAERDRILAAIECWT
jgi:hypothetical protein